LSDTVISTFVPSDTGFFPSVIVPNTSPPSAVEAEKTAARKRIVDFILVLPYDDVVSMSVPAGQGIYRAGE
jgi:hypothetical protein